MSSLWLFLKIIAGFTVVAWAEGGFQGEAGGRAAVPSSTYRGDRGAVQFAACGRHVRLVERHHLVVETRH